MIKSGRTTHMIEERRAQSLADVLRETKDIARTWSPVGSEPQELWFRGQRRSRYGLQPGLYRPENADFNYDEESLFQRFRVRGTPFIKRTVESDWDWYFLAQHHGLVTRLLDWTTNLLAACYFALWKDMETGDRRTHDAALVGPAREPIYDENSPVVWVLEAGSLNVFACGSTEEDYVFCPGGDLTSRYLPGAFAEAREDDNRYPLAILPPHSNERLTAQHGVFTVHGHRETPIDELVATAGRSPIKLARIVIDRANMHRIWDELELVGIDRLSMFPELDSVAYQTKWTGQYVRPARKEDEGDDAEEEEGS